MESYQTATAAEVALGDEPAGRPIPGDPSAALYPAEAAFLLGVTTRTLEIWRMSGGGPQYIALGRRTVRYRRCDILSFMQACERRSTSDPGGAQPDAA